MISPGNSPRCVRRSTTPAILGTIPPPLPPRKSSPTHETTILPTTSSLRNGLHFIPNGSIKINETQSVTNLSTIEIPQMAKSNSMMEMHRQHSSSIENENNVVELSSPETIYGVVISNCDSIIDSSKSQTRHLSCPSSRNKPTMAPPQPVKSNTTPNISQSQQQQQQQHNHVYENIHLELPPKHRERFNPLDKDAAVSYENLNMDYIKKLVSEGYSRDAVIKALGITRNNVDMACDILHEFGTKLG